MLEPHKTALPTRQQQQHQPAIRTRSLVTQCSTLRRALENGLLLPVLLLLLFVSPEATLFTSLLFRIFFSVLRFTKRVPSDMPICTAQMMTAWLGGEKITCRYFPNLHLRGLCCHSAGYNIPRIVRDSVDCRKRGKLKCTKTEKLPTFRSLTVKSCVRLH